MLYDFIGMTNQSFAVLCLLVKSLDSPTPSTMFLRSGLTLNDYCIVSCSPLTSPISSVAILLSVSMKVMYPAKLEMLPEVKSIVSPLPCFLPTILKYFSGFFKSLRLLSDLTRFSYDSICLRRPLVKKSTIPKTGLKII